MKTIKDIFDMLDLFYANKHLYDKAKPYIERREKWLAERKEKERV